MKFKVEVSNIYVQTHIVEADDADHAQQIGSEISDFMETDEKTFFESEWDVAPVDASSEVTYEPVQDHLK